ncbi:monoacylglycerol lipase ABHD6b isoform 1-T1 [Acanthopagrus schlegelii]
MAADLDVINLFIIAGGTLAIPILAFVASVLLWPSALIKVYYWYWRRTLGLQVRYADCGGYRFCYSYRGKPGMRPSILMLHGFSAHKDTWLTVVKYLPKHLHIVCVDMPGHEGTTRTNTEDYSIQGQVRRIHQFVEAIRLNRKPFHLVGTSMGGNVAGVYAACFPSEICSMTLICPDGIRHPCETKFDNHLQDLEHSNYTLNIPLIPTTPEEMEDMFRLCSHVRFKIPQQVRPTFQNKHSMDYTLCVPTVAHNYRNVFKSSYILCSNTFSRLDSSRTGRCPGASQHILPRSVYGACWREITIRLTGAPASHHCAFTSDMGQTRSGDGCLWSHSDFRDSAWMQDGPAGKLWTLCGDGEALSDSQTHPGVHHRAARGQGWHKEILLNPKKSHYVSPLQ